MEKLEIKEDVKSKLEEKGIKFNTVSNSNLINEVNKSNIAVARFDEENNKVIIKESLNG